jgi:hypothetical protein
MLFPIDKLQPGLVLRSDVLNSSDVALLVEGTQLTALHLRLLKQRGIVAVDVEQGGSIGNLAGTSRSNELLEEAERHVNLRLKHVPIDRPALALLRDIAVRRTAELFEHRPKPEVEKPDES